MSILILKIDVLSANCISNTTFWGKKNSTLYTPSSYFKTNGFRY